MFTLGTLEIQLLANLARLRADMEQAKGIVGGAAGAMQSAVAGLGKAFAALGVGISAAGMARWVRDVIDAADSASKLAQSIGVSVDRVAGLKLAFEQSGAGGADAMQRAMSRLSEQLVTGNKALAAMGITTRDAREALGQMADRFAGMADGSAKTAAAVEVFGAKLGAQMIPLLNQGSKGLEEMDQLARQLGLTIDQETGRRAELFNDTLDSLGQATKGIATQVASQLLPTLNALAGAFLESATAGDRLQIVADVLGGALKSLFSAAAGGVEIFNTLGKTIGANVAAAVQLAQGEWRGAIAALQAGGEDIVKGWKDTAATIQGVWSGSASAVAEKSAEMARQQRLAAQAASDLEKKLLSQSEAAKKAAAEAKRLADAEADRLSRRGLAELRRQDEAEAEAERATLARIKAEQDWLSQRSLQQQRMYDEAEAAAERAAQAAVEAQTKADAAILDDWQRTVDQMGQSLADALMTGGKSVADYLKGLFRNLVLRPILMPVATAMSAGISGPAAAAGGSGAGDMLGGLSSIGSIFSGIGSIGSIAGAGASMTMAGGLGTALEASGALLGSGLVGEGLALAAGALGPLAAAAVALYGIYNMFKHERTPHSGGAATATASGGSGAAWSDVTGLGPRNFDRIASAEESMIATARGVAQALQPLADLAGLGRVSVGAAFADDKSKDAAWGAFRVSAGGRDLANWQGTRNFADGEQGLKEFTQAIADSTREAIDSMGLPEWARNITDALGDGATLEQISGAVQSIVQMVAAIEQVRRLFDAMGKALPASGGDDIAAQLIGISGGVERLAGNLGTFYEQFYTDAEKTENATRMLGKALSDLGVGAIPQTREQFRSLVEAQDLTTEHGRQTYAGLVALAGAFAELVPATEQAGAAATGVAEAMAVSEAALREREGLEERLARATGDTATLRQREIDATDPLNRALLEMVHAAEDAAEAAQAAASLQRERAALETQLLRLQGDTTALRERELQALDPANRALQERIYALQDEAEMAAEAARISKEIEAEQQRALDATAKAKAELEQQRQATEEQRYGIETRLLQLQGDTAALRLRELEALDPANRELQALVFALEDAAEAAGAAAEAERAMAAERQRVASERYSLETRLLQLQGDTAALRLRELEALDPANRELQALVFALEDAAEAAGAAAEAERAMAAERQRVASERYSLETRLLQLQGDTAALRLRELEALDPANRELQALVFALEDAAEAAGAAAEAERAMAAERQRVASERYSLETRLLQLQGDTAKLRERELQAIDPSNKELLESIYALEDKRLEEQRQAEAARAAAAAAAEAARAAEQLRQAWMRLGETIADEIRRLRGLGTEGGAAGVAVLQARFATTSAQARAGDQAAASALAGISRDLIEAVERMAGSAAELEFAKARTAASLEETLSTIARFAGVPGFASGGLHSGGLRLVGEAGPELEYTGPSQVLTMPQFADALGTGELRTEIRALRGEVQRLRDENNAGQAVIASNTRKAARILETVTPDGDAIATREVVA